jgi:hypothetical protein
VTTATSFRIRSEALVQETTAALQANPEAAHNPAVAACGALVAGLPYGVRYDSATGSFFAGPAASGFVLYAKPEAPGSYRWQLDRVRGESVCDFRADHLGVGLDWLVRCAESV